MGRPIKKKFFGNLNKSATGAATGVGGEGVDTVTIVEAGTLYAPSATLNATFTTPQIKGGTRATGRVTTDEAGTVVGVTLLNAGAGYTAAPTFAVTPTTTGTTATFTVALLPAATTQNAIAFTSYLSTGSSAVTNGDIIKQESTRRYLVQNSEGVGQCALVASGTLAPGQMNIIATDYSGATYFVTKLTARKAYLTVRTGTDTALVSAVGGWTLGAATGTTVTIASV